MPRAFLEAWLRSVDAHNDMRKRFVEADLPQLPKGWGKEDEAWRRASIACRNQEVRGIGVEKLL